MDTKDRLKDLKEAMAKEAFGMTAEEALKDLICVYCKLPVWERIYSDAGIREYRISGLCERCFDNITGGV